MKSHIRFSLGQHYNASFYCVLKPHLICENNNNFSIIIFTNTKVCSFQIFHHLQRISKLLSLVSLHNSPQAAEQQNAEIWACQNVGSVLKQRRRKHFEKKTKWQSHTVHQKGWQIYSQKKRREHFTKRKNPHRQIISTTTMRTKILMNADSKKPRQTPLNGTDVYTRSHSGHQITSSTRLNICVHKHKETKYFYSNLWITVKHICTLA